MRLFLIAAFFAFVASQVARADDSCTEKFAGKRFNLCKLKHFKIIRDKDFVEDDFTYIRSQRTPINYHNFARSSIEGAKLNWIWDTNGGNAIEEFNNCSGIPLEYCGKPMDFKGVEKSFRFTPFDNLRPEATASWCEAGKLILFHENTTYTAEIINKGKTEELLVTHAGVESTCQKTGSR